MTTTTEEMGMMTSGTTPTAPTTTSIPHNHCEQLLAGCILGAKAWEKCGGGMRRDEGTISEGTTDEGGTERLRAGQ
jgi:hypothetical protein